MVIFVDIKKASKKKKQTQTDLFCDSAAGKGSKIMGGTPCIFPVCFSGLLHSIGCKADVSRTKDK